MSPVPKFDDRFARQNRCEPPPEFPLASPYSGIVHHLLGAATATAAAFALDSDGEEDTRPEDVAARDEQMMLLTRKMIEIRSLLQTIGQSETLTLPSIFVVGSQSPGKSSVLDSGGHCGPRIPAQGSNMVTRRPIELTLINTPKAHTEYIFEAVSEAVLQWNGRQQRRRCCEAHLGEPT